MTTTPTPNPNSRANTGWSSEDVRNTVEPNKDTGRWADIWRSKSCGQQHAGGCPENCLKPNVALKKLALRCVVDFHTPGEQAEAIAALITSESNARLEQFAAELKQENGSCHNCSGIGTFVNGRLVCENCSGSGLEPVTSDDISATLKRFIGGKSDE